MNAPSTDATPSACPSCSSAMGPRSVLCVQCGYHLKKQIHLSPAVPAADPENNRKTDPESNPFQPPVRAVSEADETISSLLQSIFWMDGRIPRWQWWTFQLGFFLVLAVISELLEKAIIDEKIAMGASCIAFWFALMAQAKRWHDMDRSSLWCLVNLIPLFGILYAIVELGFQRGTEGPNEFGPDPFES